MLCYTGAMTTGCALHIHWGDFHIILNVLLASKQFDADDTGECLSVQLIHAGVGGRVPCIHDTHQGAPRREAGRKKDNILCGHMWLLPNCLTSPTVDLWLMNHGIHLLQLWLGRQMDTGRTLGLPAARHWL